MQQLQTALLVDGPCSSAGSLARSDCEGGWNGPWGCLWVGTCALSRGGVGIWHGLSLRFCQTQAG